MDKLLSKEEFFQIYEKAVAWDKSVIGRTAGGIGSLFSFMRGKIKGAVNMAKIRSLVTNWGAEYLKAVRAVDENLPAQKGIEGEQEEISTESSNEEPLSLNKEDIDKYVELVNNKAKSVRTLYNIFNAIAPEMTSTKALDIATKSNKTAVNNVKNDVTNEADIDQLAAYFINEADKQKYHTIVKEIKPFLDKFVGDPVKFENMVDAKEIMKLVGAVDTTGVIDAKLMNKVKDKFEKVTDDLKFMLDSLVNAGSFANSLAHSVDSLKNIEKVKEENKDDEPKLKAELDKIAENDRGWIDVLKSVNLDNSTVSSQIKSHIKKYLDAVGGLLKESLILEADDIATKKLPKYVQEIFGNMDESELDKLKSIKDIKKKSTAKMNYQMLDIIEYEANYLIDKAKNSTNEKEKAQAIEMQREWDLGRKSLNNYFQDLIDVNAVMNNVKAKEPSADVKTKLINAEKETNIFENFHVEQLPNVGGQFKNNELYLFKVRFYDYKQSSTIKNIDYIGISPVANFVEEVGDAKYFWYRIFGSYSYQEESGIITRENPFTPIFPGNLPLANNFGKEGNMYFMVFENLQSVGKSHINTYIYSNMGSIFWNSKKYTKFNDELKQIIEKDITVSQRVYRVGNLTRTQILGRYLVDKTQISKYPGIELKDLTDESGYKNAKFNHDELIKLNPIAGSK